MFHIFPKRNFWRKEFNSCIGSVKNCRETTNFHPSYCGVIAKDLTDFTFRNRSVAFVCFVILCSWVTLLEFGWVWTNNAYFYTSGFIQLVLMSVKSLIKLVALCYRHECSNVTLRLIFYRWCYVSLIRSISMLTWPGDFSKWFPIWRFCSQNLFAP